MGPGKVPEKCQRRDDANDSRQGEAKRPAMSRQRAGRSLDGFLGSQPPTMARDGYDGDESSIQMTMPRRLFRTAYWRSSGKGAAIVVRRLAKAVQDLSQPVRPLWPYWTSLAYLDGQSRWQQHARGINTPITAQ